MRSATSSSAAALGLGLGLCACGAGPPSIAVITLDTVRRDHVGAYQESVGLTPNLDALAAEGLVHDAAYTTMPTTGPAHVSLFTGLYPSEHGSRRNGEPLDPGQAGRDAAARLRERGYATAAFVTTKLAAPGATGLWGFEIYDSPRGVLRPGTDAVREALAWLDVEPRRPVFLWVQLYDAHSPYGSADDKRRGIPVERGRYGWVDVRHYADPAAREEMERRYAVGVRAADAALGELVAGLSARIDPPPVILVVADHGESLDEHLDERGFAFDHGEFLDPESVAIPLVVAGPGITPGRSPGSVSIRDLYTTLLAAAGVRDHEAAAEGRRDLRLASSGRRIVGIERRRFVSLVPTAARAHRGAAADGESLVIVGEDGTLALGEAEETGDLLAVARRRALAAQASEGAPAIDPETREALRQLGYSE